MRARDPLASLIRIAARPVGATSMTRAPCRPPAGDRPDRRRLAGPGPARDQRQPVRERVADAVELLRGRARAVRIAVTRSAFRAAPRRVGRLGRRSIARSTRSASSASSSAVARGRSTPPRARDRRRRRARRRSASRRRRSPSSSTELGEQRRQRHAGAAAALGLGQQVQRRPRARARRLVGRTPTRARDPVGDQEPDAEHARQLVRPAAVTIRWAPSPYWSWIRATR